MAGRRIRYMKFVSSTTLTTATKAAQAAVTPRTRSGAPRRGWQAEAENQQQRGREHEAVQPEEDDELPAREAPRKLRCQHREQRSRARPEVDELRARRAGARRAWRRSAPWRRRTARTAAPSSSSASPRGPPSTPRSRRAWRRPRRSRGAGAASRRDTGARGSTTTAAARADDRQRDEVCGTEGTKRAGSLRSGIVRRPRAAAESRRPAPRRRAAGRARGRIVLEQRVDLPGVVAVRHVHTST